jgi:hypothetical protein
MKKQVEHGQGTEGFASFLLCAAGIVVGVTALPVAGTGIFILGIVTAATRDRDRDAGYRAKAMAESERFAETWERTRPSDESKLEIEYRLPAGGSVTSTFRIEPGGTGEQSQP